MLADVSQAGSISAVVTPRFSNLVVCSNTIDSQLNSDDPQNEVKSPAFQEKSLAQCMEETTAKDETGTQHSCGFISNAFLPCIACDESSDGRRKMLSLGGFGSKKRLSLANSFKFKEPQMNPVLCKIFRPFASSGS